ncbi:GNAT family N-acetyltransferase [Arthrobacter sp. HS15c]|uniref:GNAT family N-acetyltransferase n=1 Tax=Arthrobacter sp. HS15c TaxID=3230279 RepID=UPI0034654B5F
MTGKTYPLTGGVHLRFLGASDAERMKDAYLLNWDHLAPWEPERSDEFFTTAGQARVIAAKLAQHAAGSEVPLVLLDGDRVVGALTLTGIVRGPFLSAHLGYWVDKEYNGRGIGSAAIAAAVDFSRQELGLHRLQAATLTHNAASQKILKRAGFEEIGLATSYLRIAGAWQDHVLYQRILY